MKGFVGYSNEFRFNFKCGKELVEECIRGVMWLGLLIFVYMLIFVGLY